MNINREDLAWAAGLFEGEGSFSRHTARNGNPIAAVCMTDEDSVRKFHSIIQIGTVNGPYKSKNPKWKPNWHWRASGFHVVQAVIALLWSGLGIRRRKRAKEILTIARAKGIRNSAKIMCPVGHPYDKITKGKSGTQRYCSICHSENKKKRNAKTKRSKRTGS